MPRRQVELSDEYPYHVTARSNNRDWFNQPKDKLYDMYSNVAEKTIEQYSIVIHAFVLMDNHFHMLLSTPESNLSMAMRYFMTESSRAIARMSGRINRIYGKRYHWSIIKNAHNYAHALKYVYRNPVKACISKTVESYAWSTICQNHSKWQKIVVNSHGFDEFVPDVRWQLLDWLNKRVGDEYEQEVAIALKWHEFKFRQNRKTGKRPSFGEALHQR